MKAAMVILGLVAFNLTANASVLKCKLNTLNSANQEVEASASGKREVRVDLAGYACQADLVGKTMTARLYIPILAMDQDIAKATSNDGSAVRLELDSASCVCSVK